MKKIISFVLVLTMVFGMFAIAGVQTAAAGNSISNAYAQNNLNTYIRFIEQTGIRHNSGTYKWRYAGDTADKEHNIYMELRAYYVYGKYIKFVSTIQENTAVPSYKMTTAVYIPLNYNAKASVVYHYEDVEGETLDTKSVISIPAFNGENAVFEKTGGNVEESAAEINEACNSFLYATLLLADNHIYETAHMDAGVLGFGFAGLCEEHEWHNHIEPATTAKDGIAKTKMCTFCGKLQQVKKINKIQLISLSKTAFYYNGKVQTPRVAVKDSKGTLLKEGTDYTITLSKGRKDIGQYAVVVTFKGNYSGKKTMYYTINPLKTTLTGVSAGKNTATVKWKKVSGVSGYQIQYADNAAFKGAKKFNVKKAATVSQVIKNLQSGKQCFVRVRTYKATLFKGTETVYVYSGWSAVKSAKVK